MANYKLSRYKDDARTTNYIFTVKDKKDPDLLALKENIIRHNKGNRNYVREVAKKYGRDRALQYMNHSKLQRVSLMARGPRTVPALKDGFHRRSYDQSLPHKYATHFDVYIHTDSYSQFKLNEQIKLNITPGEQNKIDRLQREIWKLEGKINTIKYSRK